MYTVRQTKIVEKRIRHWQFSAKTVDVKFTYISFNPKTQHNPMHNSKYM